jgi:hypothetical protein
MPADSHTGSFEFPCGHPRGSQAVTPFRPPPPRRVVAAAGRGPPPQRGFAQQPTVQQQLMTAQQQRTVQQQQQRFGPGSPTATDLSLAPLLASSANRAAARPQPAEATGGTAAGGARGAAPLIDAGRLAVAPAARAAAAAPLQPLPPLLRPPSSPKAAGTIRSDQGMLRGSLALGAGVGGGGGAGMARSSSGSLPVVVAGGGRQPLPTFPRGLTRLVARAGAAPGGSAAGSALGGPPAPAPRMLPALPLAGSKRPRPAALGSSAPSAAAAASVNPGECVLPVDRGCIGLPAYTCAQLDQ